MSTASPIRERSATENQDHFLICALKKQLEIRLTSLPEYHSTRAGPERLAFLMMVADGVGGGVKGEAASRTRSRGGNAVRRARDALLLCRRRSRRSGVLRGAPGRGIPDPCGAAAARRDRSGVPRHGHHAHALSWRLASGLSAPGRRQPLLPARSAASYLRSPATRPWRRSWSISAS